MVTFLWILTLVFFIAFIVGLAKPAWIMFWSKKPKRWKLTGWYILSFFALMLAIGLIEDYSRTPQQLMTDAKVHIIAEDYSTAIDELKRIAPEDAALYAEAQELIPQVTALQKEKEKKEAAERAIREEQEKKEQELIAQKKTEEQAAREEQKRKDKEQKSQSIDSNLQETVVEEALEEANVPVSVGNRGATYKQQATYNMIKGSSVHGFRGEICEKGGEGIYEIVTFSPTSVTEGEFTLEIYYYNHNDYRMNSAELQRKVTDDYYIDANGTIVTSGSIKLVQNGKFYLESNQKDCNGKDVTFSSIY